MNRRDFVRQAAVLVPAAGLIAQRPTTTLFELTFDGPEFGFGGQRYRFDVSISTIPPIRSLQESRVELKMWRASADDLRRQQQAAAALALALGMQPKPREIKRCGAQPPPPLNEYYQYGACGGCRFYRLRPKGSQRRSAQEELLNPESLPAGLLASLRFTLDGKAVPASPCWAGCELVLFAETDHVVTCTVGDMAEPFSVTISTNVPCGAVAA